MENNETLLGDQGNLTQYMCFSKTSLGLYKYRSILSDRQQIRMSLWILASVSPNTKKFGSNLTWVPPKRFCNNQLPVLTSDFTQLIEHSSRLSMIKGKWPDVKTLGINRWTKIGPSAQLKLNLNINSSSTLGFSARLSINLSDVSLFSEFNPLIVGQGLHQGRIPHHQQRTQVYPLFIS